ncbi:radical SAM protein [Massilia sp. CCM 8733]|uniref:Radical SAM protein n=2 Tax=Massilia mucilaginosa TaxID=2609282 RepID=A0ABX0NLV5_9BURK|nr:radical SAM protein [Massilia mucilaginosa]
MEEWMAILKGPGLLARTSRDLRFMGGILRRHPFQVLVQVTNRCNMRCSFCGFWPNGVAPRLELTVADYQRVAAELARIGTFLVSVEGGEPLLRPDIIEIVRAFGKRHAPVLYTNGWFVDDAKAQGLFAAGVAQVGVSIDFADAARHDRKRRLDGAFDQAWRSVDTLLAHAPHGGAQVHVMTILMKENQDDIEKLLQMSAARGVGHCVTLLSTDGFRRGKSGEDELPDVSLSARMLDLWQRYPHLRTFRDYLERMDAFVERGPMPACHAGEQSFNIDHLGNVSPCIERIDSVVGNVRDEALAPIVGRMRGLDSVARCQDCWTLCRGFTQALGQGSTLRSLSDLSTRMRSQ